MKRKFELMSQERKETIFSRKVAAIYISAAFFLAAIFAINLYSLINIKRQRTEYLSSFNGKQNITDMANLKSDFDRVNSLIERKNFSWSIFLNKLESVTPPRISISSVTPSFSGGAVAIDGTAFSMDDLVKFIKNLQNSKEFSSVFLSEQKNLSSGNVGFMISLVYHDTVEK